MMNLDITGNALCAPKIEHFPSPAVALIWRNWGMIPVARIAKALESTEGVVCKIAELLGLDADPYIDPNWIRRGYLTIIRNNWNLCEIDQLLCLLDMNEEQLSFILKEDDFMFVKMGRYKPKVERPRLSTLSEQELLQIKHIADITKPWANLKENAFEFLEKKKQSVAQNVTTKNRHLRLVYSYSAVYGDALLDESLDPYPDHLLQEYARCGINGIWIHAVLYQIQPYKWDLSLSENWEKRVEALRRLAVRARKYGIGTYLYLNEPRPMSESFYEEFPHLKGATFRSASCLCSSSEEVLDYLENTMESLFKSVPELAGYFHISYSENFTNCASRDFSVQQTCPRCKDRSTAEIQAELHNRMAKGAHRANPDALAIVHTWGWNSNWDTETISLLNENQAVLSVSEEKMPFVLNGIKGEVIDYSISKIGPGNVARKRWKAAKDKGLCPMAKIQINCSWEMSAIPFIPVFSLVAEHVEKVKENEINDFMLTWTLGGSPSPITELVCQLLDNDLPKETVLNRFLQAKYGAAAQLICKAERKFSQAFREFPFHVKTLYFGPQNYGPMAPFYVVPTQREATMVGFPYDDIKNWCGSFTEEQLEEQFYRMVTLWEKGLEILETNTFVSDRNVHEFRNMAEGFYCHASSALNHIRFVRCREKGDTNALIEAIRKERGIVKRLLVLRSKDSRIGFEASNQYYYTFQDLREKLINLDYCEEYYKRFIT